MIFGIHTSEGKVSQRIWIEEEEEVFAFAVDGMPLMVRFDEGKEDIKMFKETCEDEKSRVRSTSLRVLGEYRRADLVPFFTDRFAKDNSYLAQAEALRSIGKCGDQTQIPFLQDAAKMKSYRNVIKRAAESALKNIQFRRGGRRSPGWRLPPCPPLP